LVFYLTELAVMVTLLFLAMWLAVTILSDGWGSITIVPIGAIILMVWKVWLAVIAGLAAIGVLLLAVDTAVNFFQNWWNKGFFAALKGVREDIGKSLGWWKEGFGEAIGEEMWKVKQAVEKQVEKVKDNWKAAKEKAGEFIDWLKKYIKGA
jgi:uncharacterized protein YjbJ (UPF0337 family)